MAAQSQWLIDPGTDDVALWVGERAMEQLPVELKTKLQEIEELLNERGTADSGEKP